MAFILVPWLSELSVTPGFYAVVKEDAKSKSGGEESEPLSSRAAIAERIVSQCGLFQENTSSLEPVVIRYRLEQRGLLMVSQAVEPHCKSIFPLLCGSFL